MAAPVDRPSPVYPTETAALAALPHREVSQACDSFDHPHCPGSRVPIEIRYGARAGSWQPRWECACDCHRPKGADR